MRNWRSSSVLLPRSASGDHRARSLCAADPWPSEGGLIHARSGAAKDIRGAAKGPAPIHAVPWRPQYRVAQTGLIMKKRFITRYIIGEFVHPRVYVFDLTARHLHRNGSRWVTPPATHTGLADVVAYRGLLHRATRNHSVKSRRRQNS